MAQLIAKAASKRIWLLVSAAVLLTGAGPLQPWQANAAELRPRSLVMDDATAAAHYVTYSVGFNISDTTTVGSVRLQFCSNTSLIDDECNAPFGFSASDAVIASQSGSTGYTISVDSTDNELILTRPPTVQPATDVKFTLVNITNPSTAGTFYARILTYSSSNATGPYTDAGGLALAIAPSLSVSTEVPPYLTFCLGESITDFNCSTATDPFSDLGDLSPTTTSAAQTQMVVATNAQNGYSLWTTGASMTSGNNVIAPILGTASKKGTSQFGINLRANSNPRVGQDPAGPGSAGVTSGYSQPNQFRFASGDTLASATRPDDYRKYTVSYIVNVSANQPGGMYSTTLTYICLGNF
jgi:hypothetical protein